MGALSFFGSAQVNFKMLQRKTFSMATAEMSQMPTIVAALSIEIEMMSRPEPRTAIAITEHSKPFRQDSRSFLFRWADGFQ
jgi:hypothetical protein